MEDSGVIYRKVLKKSLAFLFIPHFLLVLIYGLEKPIVIKANKIHTAANGTITNGMILVREGKIVRVGKNIEVPDNAILFQTNVVIPGLVDIHSHAGVYTLPMVSANMDGNEMTNPVTPEVRALDSFNFGDPALQKGLSGGVTTIVARPGSANVIGGTSVAVKLKNAPPEEMILKEPCDLKMTIEYNPVIFYGRKNRAPTTLQMVYFLARKAFIEAQDYMNEWKAYEADKKVGKDASPPKRDLGKDAIVMALKREIPIHVHVISPSEIMSAIRFADEFNLRLSLAHVPGAYLIVDELAQRKDVHFNVGCTSLYTFFQDNLKFKNVAAILANAGLSVSIQADTVGDWQHNLLYLASMSVRYGMNEEDALKALTIHGAEAVNLDDRIGSIEEGKDADLVLLNGEPFEMTTSIENVFIDGKVEYQKHGVDTGAFQTSIPDISRQLVLPENFKSPQRFVIRGGTIFTMTGLPLKDGAIMIKDGKIERIGSNIDIPHGCPVVEADDFVVMPGLVNPRSYMSIALNWRKVSSTDEISKPVVPEMEVKHAIDPQSPDFYFARQLGVTTAMVTPGNRNVIGGQGVIIKTAGSVVDQMILRDQSIMVFGMGDLAKRTNSMPTTRMGIAYLLRKALTKAREYMDQKGLKNGKENEMRSPRNFSTEALIPVLQRKKAVLIHCHRSDDIRAAIRLADEFNLKMILTGGTEAYKVADEIKRRGIPVILERIYRRRTRFDDGDFEPSNPALLAKAGIRFAFKPEEGGRWIAPAVAWGGGDMMELAALAVKHGLDEERALRAITIDAAKIIEMDQRVGSLEPGKDANILILKGHPLRVRSLPVAVFIEGKLVYLKEAGEHTQ